MAFLKLFAGAAPARSITVFTLHRTTFMPIICPISYVMRAMRIALIQANDLFTQIVAAHAICRIGQGGREANIRLNHTAPQLSTDFSSASLNASPMPYNLRGPLLPSTKGEPV